MRIVLISALVVVPFYCLCLSNNIFVVSGLCFDDQRSLLLQLKNNFTFISGSSSKLKSWNPRHDCCMWIGVSCDKEGHVTGLDLSGESISGGFDDSSVVFSLQHLQKLNMAANNFSSVIPSGFSKLDKLTYLNLSNAGFVGQIPIQISQLTRLVTLHISSTFSYELDKVMKLENPNLQKLVQNLTSIRQLYLDGVMITTPGHEWCSALSPLHDLQELSMSWCNLYGPLNPFLARLENLSVIVLDYNNLSSPVPETFSHLKKLSILSLVDCGLTRTFPLKIFNMGTLSVIDISLNNLLGFLPDFPFGGSLHTLRVSGTKFSGTIPNSIGNLRNLSELDLSFCGFSGMLPNSLPNLSQLSFLYLSFNNFTGPITSYGMTKKLIHLDLSHNGLSGVIPSSHFEGLHNLVHIDLSYNSFTGSIPSSLFALPSLKYILLLDNHFSQLDEIINVTSSRLEILDVGNNNLYGTIPSSLFRLPLLQTISLWHNQFNQLGEFRNVSSSMLNRLDLSYNNLYGTIPSSLFRLPLLQTVSLSHNHFNQLGEFRNLSSSMLNRLDLSNNILSGPFPTSIFQLSTLSVLQLSSNKFNGSVQLDKLFQHNNFTKLDLSHNNLSVDVNISNVNPSFFSRIINLKVASCNLKTFPSFLRNLSGLTYLDLSDNQIQGIVPNWIWKLENLQSLNISHNLLTGLEGPLQNLTSSLYVIDLHYNKLQGPIPVFSKYANVLDYSNNKFSSFIPLDFGNHLSSTFFLSLSNNTLHGSIPDSLCNASSLQMLDLSINNISGTIPPCLMMMNGTLEILNLKDNNLSGPIPDTVSTSCGLSTLNLHGNLLDGLIPKSLAYCSMLEVLDLGSNQIIDGFPCFLKEIPALRVLVLRNNKFQGSITCSKANETWEMLQIVDLAFNNFSGKLPGKYFINWKRNTMYNEDEAGSKFIERVFYESDGSSLYYQDSVTVMSKGLKQELVKILTIFTSIDFSSNHFEGPIPEELTDFKALYILNLSNNALSGEIPSSIGNLRQLESLDLSQNSLSGEIPSELASLSFLSYLNLSLNLLVGKIPISTQLQSFPASSFEGNVGLYGPPLTENLHDEKPMVLPQPKCGRLSCTVDWNFISVELGLVFGHIIVFGPLLIWKQWRIWYWQLVHKILCWIFPKMYLEYVTRRGQTYATLRWRY